MWELENHGHQWEEPASGPAYETFTNEFPQGMERKNWPNTTNTEPISVGQHKIDLAITITAEEQDWANEFVIAADEAMGDMSWMNWMLEQERVLEYSRLQIIRCRDMHRQYPRYLMGTKPFMYSIYIALKMSLEKTIEIYNKK
jgi:hypothetical protein